MSPDLTHTVRDALEHRAGSLDVRTPPWQELEAGFGRVRRARRRRRVARVGGGLVAVLVAAGGVQVGVVPYPTWAPAVAIAAAPSALDTGATRGSLGSDTAFLVSLRRAVAVGTASAESEGTWQVPSPDDVHVLYASDVGTWRIALVEARMRTGLLEGRQQMWFAGPRGAPADRLQNMSGNQPHDEATAWFEGNPGADGAGVFVAVSARSRAFLLTTAPPVYKADGTVTRKVERVDPRPDGVVEREVPTTPTTVVLASPDTSPRQWEHLRSNQGEASDAPRTPRTAVDGRPVPSTVGDQLEAAFAYLTGESGLSNAPRSVLGTGPLGPWSAAVVAVRAPSGARLVRVEVSAPVPDRPGEAVGTGVSTVVPAGPPGEVGLAWQLSDPGDKGDDRPVRHVGVLGPVGATSARLVDGSAQLAQVNLTDRFGLLPPPGAGHQGAKVQFADAAGRVLTTVAVLDLHAELPTGLPQ